MGKLTKASDDVIEFVNNIVMEYDLDAFASFKVLNISGRKNPLVKVSKASATSEYFIKASNCVIVYVNEEIWDMCDDKTRDLLVRNALNGIHYDDEKDKMSVEQPEMLISLGCYRKYGKDLVDAMEVTMIAREQLAEKEKEEKEAKRAAKAAKKDKWLPEGFEPSSMN